MSGDFIAFLFPLFIFATVILIITILFYCFSYYWQHRTIIEKIKRDGSQPRIADLSRVSGTKAVISLVKQYLVRIMSSLGNVMKPKSEGELSSVQKKLIQAGYRGRNATIIFFGAKGFFALLLPSFFLLVNLFHPISLEPRLWLLVLILLATVGLYLPHLWLRIQTDRRKEKICEGFPDALDLLVVCVEAGMGLDAAISRVAEEMRLINKEISDEFQVLNQELRAGRARIDALRSLASRCDLEDIKRLVTLLIQAERFGTGVAQALRIYSDAMRVKRQQRAEEEAAKLPVKILFPLIFFIFPALFVVILGPAIIKIFKELLPIMGKK
ncbi:MAG: type II secretion system F family protein [bacterium]|nr:type II secretion system F family protein [bacterium]